VLKKAGHKLARGQLPASVIGRELSIFEEYSFLTVF
jgi:hypothetical protein